VFKTVIPRSIRLAEAPSYGVPVSAYAPESPGALAYQTLAQEVLTGDGVRATVQTPESSNPSGIIT
jgi:chromosome partitioning protein